MVKSFSRFHVWADSFLPSFDFWDNPKKCVIVIITVEENVHLHKFQRLAIYSFIYGFNKYLFSTYYFSTIPFTITLVSALG